VLLGIASSFPSVASAREIDDAPTKVLICIDGLEEDILNKEKWEARIRECEELVKQYPKLRFLFSARDHFYRNPDDGKAR